MEPRRIRVQTQAPTEGSMGAVEEFDYQIDSSGRLSVTDLRGLPVGATVVMPGSEIETYDAAARRIVTRLGGESSFWRKMN
jgi:hypothetical protein